MCADPGRRLRGMVPFAAVSIMSTGAREAARVAVTGKGEFVHLRLSFLAGRAGGRFGAAVLSDDLEAPVGAVVGRVGGSSPLSNRGLQ